jgi:hypothetical protein
LKSLQKNWKPVAFKEPPASIEERAIAVVLREFAEAIDAHDIEGIAKILAPNAMMSHRPGEPISRDRYLEEMRTVLETIRRIEYHNAIIRKTGNHLYTVQCESYLHLRRRLDPLKRLRYFYFTGIDNHFYISESGFI